jgi:hypothetical protein
LERTTGFEPATLTSQGDRDRTLTSGDGGWPAGLLLVSTGRFRLFLNFCGLAAA